MLFIFLFFMKFQGFAYSKQVLGTLIVPTLASVSSCHLSGGKYCLEIWEQISVAFTSLNRYMSLSKTIPIKHIEANEVDSLVSVMVRKSFQDVKGSNYQ